MKNKFGNMALVLNVLMIISEFGGHIAIVEFLQLFNKQGFYPFVAFGLNVLFLTVIFFLIRSSFKLRENRNLSIANLIMLIVSAFLFLKSIFLIALLMLFGGF